MRKVYEILGYIFIVIIYYCFFFTKVVNVQIRQIAYLLSGSDIHLGSYIAHSREVVQQMSNPIGQEMVQQYYGTALQTLQLGPYINFTVYMLTFFIVVPLFLVSMLVFRRYTEKDSFTSEMVYWKQFTTHFWNYLFTAFMLSGLGSILSSLLSSLTKSELTSANQAAIKSNLQSNFIISIVPIVLLAPIIEEIVFRGVILSGIRAFLQHYVDIDTTKKIRIYQDIQFYIHEIGAIILSSMLFALIHLSSNWDQWVYFPAYFCGGLALGGIYVWNKERIYASMIIHAVYNALPIFFTTILRLITKG